MAGKGLKTIKVIALLNFNVNLFFDLAAHLLWVIRITFYKFNIVALDQLIFILVLASVPSAH